MWSEALVKIDRQKISVSHLVGCLAGGVQYVVDGANGQDRETGLLGQHGRRGHGDSGRQAGPFADSTALGHAAGQAVQIAGARAQAQRGKNGAHRRAQAVCFSVAAGVAAHDPAARVGSAVPVPDVCHVAQERRQVEQAGQQVSAAHHAGHGFCVHRVHSKNGRGYCGPAPGQQRPVQRVHQIRGCAVEQHVGRVIAARVQAAGPVVQPERRHAQRPVRAVRVARPDRRAPEVVSPDVAQRRRSGHVRVVDDSPAKIKQIFLIFFYYSK